MRRLTFPAVVLAAAFALSAFPTFAQTPFSLEIQPEWLKEVLPDAETFSDKAGDPPVYSGFRNNPDTGEQELVGYVFLTDDFKPERVGYAAPIDSMVGLSVDGEVTNIKVLDYTESYLYSRGDFIDNSVFLSQFRRKPLTDEFRLRRDIDGLTAATATSTAIIRSVSEGARRVARTYLGYEEGSEAERNNAANAMAQLEQMSWDEMLASGMIVKMDAVSAEGQPFEMNITYIGRPVLGEYFIGEVAHTAAKADIDFRAGPSEMMLIMSAGEGAGEVYRPYPMSVRQGDIIRRVAGNRFANGGDAGTGVIAGHAAYGVVVSVHPDIDITQPFSFIYHTPGGREETFAEYSLGGLGLTLARNEPVLSDDDILQAMLADAGFFQRLQLAPPWGETMWVEVLLLGALLSLVMLAFLSKQSTIRWTAMTMTLFYLGFYKQGFLSVSHITSLIKQGPMVFTSNLTTLMIVVFTIVTTLIWGRIFCSSLCPFGALQDFLARFSPRRWKIRMPQAIHDRAIYIKYGILTLILALAVTNPTVSVFQYFEPFGTIFFLSPSVLLWVILVAILVACVLVERFYCRYVCPLGAALGVISHLSPLRIRRVPQCTLCKVCEQSCPTGAIRREQIDFKECVRCDVCETKLIKKAGTCRHPMEEIARRRKDKPTQEVPDLIPVSAI